MTSPRDPTAKPREKVALICIDGWGISPVLEGNAVYHGETPYMDKFEKEYPFTPIEAHGLAVGLPEGLMGNSEVGHLNIGAGRVVYQDIVRIDLAVRNKQFGSTENIRAAFENAKKNGGRIHFLGLVSDGGVHSHIDHLSSLLEAAKEADIPKAYVQFFGDGRDTAPRSSVTYIEQLQDEIKRLEYGSIATIVGRYYAMDRDKRWERVKIAVDGLVKGEGEKTDDPIKTVKERYDKDETDEFLKPIIVDEEGRIREGDTLFFFNFRSDRMREIVSVFGIDPKPMEVEVPKNLHITCMTQYKSDYPFPLAFPPQSMDNVLAEWLSKYNIPQVHVAETEKYAHVTFFFNGGTEAQFSGETRDLINSPKVATYDKQPEMSSAEVGEKVVEEIESGKYPFVMCNFAPPDMVGHTGVYDAALKGVHATDAAIGRIYEACKRHNYILFITADHGNAEKMYADDGSPFTAHTTNPVPFIMCTNKYKFNVNPSQKALAGALCDVAPTILTVMGLEKPIEMGGSSLVD